MFLVFVIVFQFVTIVRTNTNVRASDVPNGDVKSVIVQFKGSSVTSNADQPVQQQVADLAERQQWLEGMLANSAGYKKLQRTYSQLPIAVYTVDEEGEASLRENPNVISVTDDEILKPLAITFQLPSAVNGGDWQTGFSDGSASFTGDGYAVAVIDSGVDKTHPSLSGTVISEACYGINQDYTNATVASACPGGATSSTASGSGVPCLSGCDHGTMVAGNIAMQQTTGLTVSGDAVEASGVAQDAKIIAIQSSASITEKVGQGDLCGNVGLTTQTCYSPIISLVLAGLNRVIEIENTDALTTPIASVNVSIGDPNYYTADQAACGNKDATNTAINSAAASLKNLNVATIFATGNSGDPTLFASNINKITSPACLSNVVAVSASTADGHVASYSNAGPLTDLVAPGGEIDPNATHTDGGIFVAKPGADLASQYTVAQGTSFAAPMVAAAWAVIREKAPQASVDGILAGLKQTGATVTEDRAGYTAVAHKELSIAPTLEIASSLDQHVPVPVVEQPTDTEGPTDTTWIPGVPNAGIQQIQKSVALIVLSVLLLIIINRSLLLRKQHAK